jgi:hypothetical protein
MCPAIQAIPTFGTYRGVTTGELGINQLRPNILVNGMAWMVWTARTAARRSRVSSLRRADG